jgi:hypothetical protein
VLSRSSTFASPRQNWSSLRQRSVWIVGLYILAVHVCRDSACTALIHCYRSKGEDSNEHHHRQPSQMEYSCQWPPLNVVLQNVSARLIKLIRPGTVFEGSRSCLPEVRVVLVSHALHSVVCTDLWVGWAILLVTRAIGSKHLWRGDVDFEDPVRQYQAKILT